MKSLQKDEDLVMQEIMSFPREKLPQVTKLLRLLRQEFALETGKKSVSSPRRKKITLE